MLERKSLLVGTVLVVLGCADKEVSDESGNPFGDGTGASTGATGDGTSVDSGEAGPTGSGVGSVTGEPTTSPPMTASGSSSGGPPTTGAPTTGDSSGSPGDGQLGECMGTGAWESCAQYCQANLDVCVEAGCGGMTVVYYNDVGACTAMEADGGEAIGCSEGFAMGGGISFARCCCQ